MSVRSYSPSLSTSMPGTPSRRRLSSSSRRGSTSAPDPWALSALDAPASSTSRLHIVRLPPPTKEELERYDKEHGTSRRASWGASGLSKSISSDRVSFATGLSRTGSAGDQSRPRIHPSSHTGALAPQQLYDLAMSSINPVVSSDGASLTSPMPAVFTPLPENHYLPFIVRSSEVHQLLSQGPPRRLWALIKQIYPTNLVEESDEPTKWPFTQLERWMFKVDRHEASDRVWVAKARACISRRSEPLWEKLKNALGVPPELELSDSEDSDDEELEAVVDSMVGLDVTGKTHPAPSAVIVPNPTKVEATASTPTKTPEDDEEFSEMGPTGLVMEAIYPSAAPSSPVQSKPSPSKRDDGFGGGMEIIGEEEEEEDKAGASGMKLKTEDLAETPKTPEKDAVELDPSRMVGITFVSHSRYVPLKQYIERDEASDGEAVADSPIFPSSFASLAQNASPMARRGSRGAFFLEQGSMSVRGPSSAHPPREYAISTGSESDYDGR